MLHVFRKIEPKPMQSPMITADAFLLLVFRQMERDRYVSIFYRDTLNKELRIPQEVYDQEWRDYVSAEVAKKYPLSRANFIAPDSLDSWTFVVYHNRSI